MTKKSRTPVEARDDEPIHVFDQTNGVLGDAPEPARKDRATGSGDLPGATHLVIGGF